MFGVLHQLNMATFYKQLHHAFDQGNSLIIFRANYKYFLNT